MLELQAVGYLRHPPRIPPQHLDFFPLLPGRVPLLQQVLGRRPRRSRSPAEELNVHRSLSPCGPRTAHRAPARWADSCATTATASAPPLWVFAQRASWFRLFPIRASSRVRSRSTAAAAAVQVRVRAMARRSSSDSDTPAARALQRHSASSAADTRTVAVASRAIEVSVTGEGGRGRGDWGARGELPRVGGSKGPEPLASPNVLHWVGWLPGTTRCGAGLAVPASHGAVARLDPLPPLPSNATAWRVPIPDGEVPSQPPPPPLQGCGNFSNGIESGSDESRPWFGTSD